MQYILMIYARESGWSEATPAQKEAAMAAYTAYTQALAAAGVLKDVNRLGPSANATTVHLDGGKPVVLDGPYADSKEQFGGYYIIDVPDLDAAVS
jgi:hypothetical protein